MAYSNKTYSGDGVTKLFTVTFPYIDPSHVTVLVNGTPAAFSFQSKYVVELPAAPGVGAVVKLVRNSNPETRLVDFQDDSMGTEALFNLNADQLLYLAQEAMDKSLEGTVIEEVQAVADAALASAVLASTKATQATNAVAAITLPLPITSGGTGSTSAEQARTSLGLGTAATKNVGTAEGELVAVGDSGKLPTLDGTNLTGLNRIVQDSLVFNTSLATGTTLIPLDDTIPQNTEGWLAQSKTITPTAIGNKITVEVTLNLAPSAAATITAALFQDELVDAVSVGSSTGAASYVVQVSLRYRVTATSLSPLNFNVRVGTNVAATLTLNGVGGARRFGGVLSSTMRVYEVKP
jgi:hypothetical protein